MKQAATEAKLQASNAAAKEIFSQQKTKEVEEHQSEISDLKKRLQQIQHDKSQVRMLLDDVYKLTNCVHKLVHACIQCATAVL